MKSTRDYILRTLLAFPGSSINDLADAVGINGISIRHHLTALEAEDLVTSSEERHGVGRPRLIYSLTDKGIEEFPTSYLRLTRRILDALKDSLSKKAFIGILTGIGQDIANQYMTGLDDEPLEDRIKRLKSAMTKEGFIVEWEKNKDNFSLTTLSCPYHRIGIEHPEICNLDYALISTLLSTPVEIKSCIFEGSDRCVYKIPFEN